MDDREVIVVGNFVYDSKMYDNMQLDKQAIRIYVNGYLNGYKCHINLTQIILKYSLCIL